MILSFVTAFQRAKPEVRAELAKAQPDSYDDLLTRLVKLLADTEDRGEKPDPARITVIDHGHYQGTRLFIVGAEGYQPSTYWSVFVGYGSCSGCDTFESIKSYDSDPPTKKQIDGYWTMMLHMVESMKRVGEASE